MTVIQINCLYKFRNPLLVSFHFILFYFFFSIIPQTTKNSTNSAGKDSLN